jgi:formate/nitrite transporter FocA (FNT family)
MSTNSTDQRNSAAVPDGTRMTAAQIFAVASQTGEDELKRSSAGLALSGLAAGLGMGLTGLGSATIQLATGGQGSHAHLLASLLYPLGFIVVILGRAQLFTENTLFPVILVLDRRRHVRNTLRLWAVVFVANVIGALLFAVLAVKTSALSAPLRSALATLGERTVSGSFGHIFWAGVIGGWIIALMAWLVSAARFSSGQIALVYVMTFVVGAAHLAHCIAGSGEALAAVLTGHVSAGSYVLWLLGATLGNTVGGVLMVSLLNYGQVVGSGRDVEQAERSLQDIENDMSNRSAGLRHRRRAN